MLISAANTYPTAVNSYVAAKHKFLADSEWDARVVQSQQEQWKTVWNAREASVLQIWLFSYSFSLNGRGDGFSDFLDI